jgi:hypothetical protein
MVFLFGLDEKPEYDFDNSKILADSFKNEDGSRMSVLSRYETTLEKSLYRALHELQRLQAQRHGHLVMPPLMLDVNVSREDVFGKSLKSYGSVSFCGASPRKKCTAITL